MNQTFEKLNTEKKEKIINVCLEEFVQKGFELASTNNIVVKAGISKGLLFHYFGSKKNIYLYLLDYAIEYFIKKFYSYDVKASGDIFERIMQRGVIKMKIAGEKPLLYKLLMEAFVVTPAGLEDEMNLRYQKIYSENMPVVFEDIDYSLFRDEVDIKKALEFITLCFDSIYNKYIKSAKGRTAQLSLEETEIMVNEYKEHIDMIKYGICKK
ncbi:MAG: hypothetical protein K0R50_4229 [Eubacterium sp.]|jgi:AcrR family transcriptional regulator|nr:hypothetical protein [Eubacterium sp.]